MNRFALLTAITLGFGFCWLTGSSFAQEATAPAARRAARRENPEDHRPPVFFKVAWHHTGVPPEHPVDSTAVADPNLEMHLYGDMPKPDPEYGGIWLNKRFANDPAHAYTGTCRTPCGLTISRKDATVNLTGLAKIGWSSKAQGFHVARPLIKLADGGMYVGDIGDGYAIDWHTSEYNLTTVRWRKIDPKTMINLTSA
ncbi:MAG: hypothetical protein ACRD30_01240, partial [Bryobacteraceae bacterium]